MKGDYHSWAPADLKVKGAQRHSCNIVLAADVTVWTRLCVFILRSDLDNKLMMKLIIVEVDVIASQMHWILQRDNLERVES